VADGKLYIFDVKGKLVVITLKGEEAPDPDETFEYRFRGTGGLLNETNGTPIAVNGRIYFTTRTDLLCVGDPKAKPECDKYVPLPEETPFKENAIAGVRLFPADVTAKPGEKVQFQVVYFDENGREVKDNRPSPVAKWSLPLPPKTPAGAQPPALQGTIEGGTLTLAPIPGQQGYVAFECGPTARARVRVAPQPPYSQNFDKVPAGATPAGWVNTQGKYFVKQLPGGEVVLAKVNTDSRPPIAKANGYITGPEAADYTIQADLQGTLVRGQMPDVGIVNCRYLFVLAGAPDPATGKREARLQSWEGKRRVEIPVQFDWAPGTWYTAKLSVEPKEKTALVRAKVWKRGEKEPEKWTIEFEDPNPNREGAAALYGYVSNVVPGEPGADAYYDNVEITPNAKK
jgi:hypothetical protein